MLQVSAFAPGFPILGRGSVRGARKNFCIRISRKALECIARNNYCSLAFAKYIMRAKRSKFSATYSTIYLGWYIITTLSITYARFISSLARGCQIPRAKNNWHLFAITLELSIMELPKDIEWIDVCADRYWGWMDLPKEIKRGWTCRPRVSVDGCADGCWMWLDVPAVIESGWMCRRILSVNGCADGDWVW